MEAVKLPCQAAQASLFAGQRALQGCVGLVGSSASLESQARTKHNQASSVDRLEAAPEAPMSRIPPSIGASREDRVEGVQMRANPSELEWLLPFELPGARLGSYPCRTDWRHAWTG